MKKITIGEESIFTNYFKEMAAVTLFEIKD